MKYYKFKKSAPKKNKLRRFFWGVGMVMVLYLCFGADYNLYKFWKLKQKKQEAISRIKGLESAGQQLSIEIDKLNNDLAYIEKIAREEYKMAKKGETIYLIKEKESNE